jgi:hypothetical protein
LFDEVAFASSTSQILHASTWLGSCLSLGADVR